MKKDFKTLTTFSESKLPAGTQHMFSIYEKWDILKSETTYVAAIELADDSGDEIMADDMVSGVIPA